MHRGTIITLGPLRESDSETLFKWINTRELVLLSSNFRPVHQENHKEWFRRIQGSDNNIIFAIRTNNTDSLIGTCQLHSIHSVFRNAELQIRIGEVSHLSKGCGTEAVKLLLDYAFKDLNLERVHLHVLADNQRAVRTYTKCGFQHEGILRKAAYVDGCYRDIVIMAVLREEWVKHQA
jgi:RimJ/RimL family protein N-acetyltransferase